MEHRYHSSASGAPKSNIEPYLVDYLDGALSPEEARWVEMYLEAHPVLRRRLEGIRQVRDLLAQLPRVRAPEGFEERLRARIRAEEAWTALPAPDAERRTWAVGWMFVAALLLSGMALWAWEESRRQQTGALRATYYRVSGEIRASVGGFEAPLSEQSMGAQRGGWPGALPLWPGWRLWQAGRSFQGSDTVSW